MSDTRFCPNCGVSAPRGRFCPSCGGELPDLSGSDAETPTTDPSPATNGAEGSDGPVAVAPVSLATAQPTHPQGGAAPLAQPSSAGPPPPLTAPPSAGAAKPWLPYALIGGVIVAIGAIATVILLIVGGEPEAKRPAKPPTGGLTAVALSAQNIYTQVQRQNYYAMLPAGWTTSNAKTDAALADSASVVSAQDTAIKVTVGEAENAGSLQDALGAAGKQSQVILLPGKRTARRSETTTGGVTQVGYSFKNCDRTYVVLGVTPAAKLEQVKSRFGVIASTLQATC